MSPLAESTSGVGESGANHHQPTVNLMSDGRFVSFGSTYSQDHAAQAHREREQAMATQERAERWIARRLAGQSFTTLETLTDAALAVTVAHYARELTEQETTLIVRSCVALFAGLVDARYFAGKLLVARGERVTFLAAA